MSTSTIKHPDHIEGVHRPGRWLALSVLVLAVLLVAVDATVLGLATPFLSEDLKPSGTQLLWIGDVYSFVIAGLLVSMGSLGDRIGRKKLLLIGATAFGAVSVLNAYATSPEMMIVARALLGVAERDPDAVHPGAHPEPLPRPARAQPRHRHLGCHGLGRCRRRTGRRRFPPGALLVGFGLPHQPARDGRPRPRRHQDDPRVEEPEPGPLGPAERHAVPRRPDRDRLRDQGTGLARPLRRRGRRRPPRSRRPDLVRPQAADPARAAPGHASVPPPRLLGRRARRPADHPGPLRPGVLPVPVLPAGAGPPAPGGRTRRTPGGGRRGHGRSDRGSGGPSLLRTVRGRSAVSRRSASRSPS